MTRRGLVPIQNLEKEDVVTFNASDNSLGFSKLSTNRQPIRKTLEFITIVTLSGNKIVSTIGQNFPVLIETEDSVEDIFELIPASLLEPSQRLCAFGADGSLVDDPIVSVDRAETQEVVYSLDHEPGKYPLIFAGGKGFLTN